MFTFTNSLSLFPMKEDITENPPDLTKNRIEPYSIAEFATLKAVPEEAVLHAIRMNKLRLENSRLPEIFIPIYEAEKYNFEMLSPYEYAARKNVSPRSVYNKINSGAISYTLKPGSTPEEKVYQIDWTAFGDIHFRLVKYKFRGKDRTIDKS